MYHVTITRQTQERAAEGACAGPRAKGDAAGLDTVGHVTSGTRGWEQSRRHRRDAGDCFTVNKLNVECL